jgi:ferredoxin
MKTHQLERITGGVKNMFGCVYGMNKGASHAKYPDAESFAQMLIDLNLLLKARLHIMDGVVAMEGNGPGSGTPVKMNVMLFSEDPVALDATFCRLVDLDPSTIPTVFYGAIFGLGRWKEGDIEIVGVDNLADYSNPRFDVPREKTSGGKWSYLNKLKVLARKPVILKEKCVRCGACVAACPLEDKAVYFPGGEVSRPGMKREAPVYDYRKCIRCYCCQEMCPEKAIIVKRKLI